MENRVLIADSSAKICKLLFKVLSENEKLQVVGVTHNSGAVLDRIYQFNPDIVILDIEMSELKGMETLVDIRKTHPKLPIIIFSTAAKKGAVTTLEALISGASDYVTKPEDAEDTMAYVKSIKEDLIPKIMSFCSKTTSEWFKYSQKYTSCEPYGKKVLC